MKAGITIEENLERICIHFERMHALYGHRANVSLPNTSCFGLPGHFEMFVDHSSGDDNSDENQKTQMS